MALSSFTCLSLLFTLFAGHNVHSKLTERHKRQSVTFGQGSYSFFTTSCIPGVIAGTTTASGATYYTIANPSQYFGVNSNNGQVILTNYLTANVPESVTIQAYVGPGLSGASSTTQVTVTCGTGSSTTATTAASSSGVTFGQASYSFYITSCIPGVIAGTTPATGATYYTIANPSQYFGVNSNTGQIILTNYLTANVPQSVTIQAYVGPGFSGPSSTTQVTVTCGTSGSATGVPVATQSPYAMSTSTCTVGGAVGTVTVTNPAQVVFASTTQGSAFSVSSAGVITVLTAIQSGTYVVYVTAANPYGTTSIPVTVTATCSSSTGTGTSIPQFPQGSYAFYPTCATAGATVGTVAVSSSSGSVTYVIQPIPTPAFAISSAGVITFTGNPLPASGSTSSFSVVATNSAGQSVAMVTVVPGTCGASTGTFQFAQSSYTLSPTICQPGSAISAFAASNAPGAVTYSIAQPNLGYVISQSGVLSAPSGVTAGTITVQATSNGQTTSTSVTISTASCPATTIATTAATTASLTTAAACTPGAKGCGDIG